MKKISKFVIVISALTLLFCGCEKSAKQGDISEVTSGFVSSKRDDISYEEFQEPEGNSVLTEITSEQLKTIPKNTTYKEIFYIIGEGADFYNSHLAVYKLDGEKILALNFKKEEDLCPYSGEELIDFAVMPKKADELNIPNSDNENIVYIYGIVVYRDMGISIYSPDSIYSFYDVGYTRSNISFSDGTSATVEDIGLYDELIVSCEEILDSTPPQVHCMDITILK